MSERNGHRRRPGRAAAASPDPGAGAPTMSQLVVAWRGA
jgi:hypothetical protein